ncbi:MAG: MBL fold metallo-hydrolase, partial [Tidjanibacter sp.]|nr:MBL fold metallo-hydrolase [Tidjanibacter sp.]
MTFKVTILGSSSAKPSVRKHHSAHTLNAYEQFYLIDCGEGTQRRLMECGISPMKINAIFISHLHGDHVFGLFPLISTLGLQGRKLPLDIYAPHPMGEILEAHYRWYDTKLPFEVRYHEVDTRSHTLIYENKVMEVWTVPLRHRTPCCGY